jgi:hypothetical protein
MGLFLPTLRTAVAITLQSDQWTVNVGNPNNCPALMTTWKPTIQASDGSLDPRGAMKLFGEMTYCVYGFSVSP